MENYDYWLVSWSEGALGSRREALVPALEDFSSNMAIREVLNSRIVGCNVRHIGARRVVTLQGEEQEYDEIVEQDLAVEEAVSDGE